MHFDSPFGVGAADAPRRGAIVRCGRGFETQNSPDGYIIDGRIHAHITMANPEKAFGGYLEPGTNVFTFVSVTIGVLADGVDISRVDDKTYR